MLRYFSRSIKPRVFLNSLKVVPKGELSFVEKWIYNEHEGLDLKLHNKLSELLTLPHISTVDEPKSNDLAIDIAVPKYQTGEWGYALFGEVSFPLFWRPRLEIVSRLFEVKSGKTLSTFSVIQKMPWLYYFGRIFTLSSFISIRSQFKPEDFEYVLTLGIFKLIDRMRKSI